jgi:hypothetical protein
MSAKNDSTAAGVKMDQMVRLDIYVKKHPSLTTGIP